jgi:RNAse (barnase) inhibitor barstar
MKQPFIPEEFYTVDFTGVKNYGDIYPLIKRCLKVPQNLGENKDALWDIITGFIGGPSKITIKGVSSLPNHLQKDIEDILNVFDCAMDKYPFFIQVQYHK